MLKTLTKIVLVLILFTCFLECKFGENKHKKAAAKEFEGVITYHEIIKNNDSLFNSDDTVQVFYSHGNYIGIHSEKSSKFHLVKDYYFESKPLRLLLFNNSDTLHQLSLNFPIEKLDDFKVQRITEKILSRNCEKIDLAISYPDKDSTSYTDISFSFSRNYLKINKDHFKRWNLGFFNKVIDEAGVYYLRMKSVHFDSSHKNILSSKTYDVISVKEQIIDPEMLKIDPAKIK